MIQLTQRERRLAIAGSSILGLGLLYGFVIKPIQDRTQRLYELLPDKHKTLEQVEQLGQEIRHLQTGVKRLHSSIPHTTGYASTLTYLENLLTKHQLKQSASLVPEQPIEEGPYTVTVIQIDLQAIALPRLLSFLQELNFSEQPLKVETMGLNQNNGTSGSLDAHLILYSTATAKNV